MDLIVNNGVSAISLPADEVGMLVQSVSWSGRTDVVEYKDASKHGSIVARQDRNPVLSLGINAYLMSATTGLWTIAMGTSVAAGGQTCDMSNFTLATVASPFFGIDWAPDIGGTCILDNASVSADGEANPRVDLAFKIYPFIPG